MPEGREGRPFFYTLIGPLPVPCFDAVAWNKWFAAATKEERLVGQTVVGPLMAFTMFLGADHNLHSGPPWLFETMILGIDQHGRVDTGDEYGYQTRCSTWAGAEHMHAAARVVAASWVAAAGFVTGRWQAIAEGGQGHDRSL